MRVSKQLNDAQVRALGKVPGTHNVGGVAGLPPRSFGFAKRGIPVIPVHDSFLIARRHWIELYRVMHDAYRHHSGGFTCPIRPSDSSLYPDIAQLRKAH